MDEVKDKARKSVDVTSWEQEYVTDLPNEENLKLVTILSICMIFLHITDF